MVTAVVWAGVPMSGWYWTQVGLAVGSPVLVVAPSAVKTPEISSPVEWARLLGATAPVAAGSGPGPTDRFILSGVIASGVGQGAALVAVDGKPARPFAVGSELAPGYVLVSVAPREAMLAEGLFAPVRAVLSLPMPLQAESSAVPPAIAPAVPVPPGGPTATQVPLPVPARADARRQPQTTLRRDDRRTN
jgi:general secretion pathway protein C